MAAVPKPTSSKSNSSKPSRPQRDEYEMMELGETLTIANQEKKTLIFSIWKRYAPIKGKVIKLDGETQRIHIQTQFEGIYKIPFVDILKAVDVEEG